MDKNSKRILFERMHSIGGMPLKEDTHSPEFKEHLKKQKKLIEDVFKRKFGTLYDSSFSRATEMSNGVIDYQISLEDDDTKENSSIKTLHFSVSYYNNGRIKEIEPVGQVTDKYFKYIDKMNAGGNAFDVVNGVFVNKSELDNEELYSEFAEIIEEIPQFKENVALE